jgi:hypothetical protein
MKIIKKFVTLIKITLACLIFLIIGCKRRGVEKKEDFGLKGSIKNEQSQLLRASKWKLRRFKVIDRNNRKIIYEKDVENMILSFGKNRIFLNNQEYGTVNYKANEFVINNIDTLTNRFYLLHLRNGQLILKNDILYYKEKKLFKQLAIELNLSTDTIKSNKDFYRIEY